MKTANIMSALILVVLCCSVAGGTNVFPALVNHNPLPASNAQGIAPLFLPKSFGLLPPNGTQVVTPAITPTYDEQLYDTFTQNFVSFSYYIGAIEQLNSNGNGPAYLVNGLTNNGYWYQFGLAYYWPGGYSGFAMLYEVWNPQGQSIVEGYKALPGVSEGYWVEMSISISGGNVIGTVTNCGMYGTSQISSFSYQYSAEGATTFVGNSNEPGSDGEFTGLMSEFYYPTYYAGDQVRVPQFNFSQPLASGWLGGDEWIPNTGQSFWSTYSLFVYSNEPTTLQTETLAGTSVSGDAYLFLAGTEVGVPASYESTACIALGTSCPTSYTFSAGSYVSIGTFVPTDTTPVQIQCYINSEGGSVNSWSIAATGWEYIFAGYMDTPGTYYVWTVTTFSNQYQYQSNDVIITIS